MGCLKAPGNQQKYDWRRGELKARPVGGRRGRPRGELIKDLRTACAKGFQVYVGGPAWSSKYFRRACLAAQGDWMRVGREVLRMDVTVFPA